MPGAQVSPTEHKLQLHPAEVRTAGAKREGEERLWITLVWRHPVWFKTYSHTSPLARSHGRILDRKMTPEKCIPRKLFQQQNSFLKRHKLRITLECLVPEALRFNRFQICHCVEQKEDRVQERESWVCQVGWWHGKDNREFRKTDGKEYGGLKKNWVLKTWKENEDMWDSLTSWPNDIGQKRKHTRKEILWGRIYRTIKIIVNKLWSEYYQVEAKITRLNQVADTKTLPSFDLDRWRSLNGSTYKHFISEWPCSQLQGPNRLLING